MNINVGIKNEGDCLEKKAKYSIGLFMMILYKITTVYVFGYYQHLIRIPVQFIYYSDLYTI